MTSLRLSSTAIGDDATRTSSSSSSLAASVGAQRAAMTSESVRLVDMASIVAEVGNVVNIGKLWSRTARGT